MSFRRGKSFGNEEEQSRKLFVGGLSFDTTDETLKNYFDTHGTIVDCVVIKDRITQKSKGFGFVTYETEEEADRCMNNRPHELDSRIIDVKRAVSREESTRPGAHVSVKKIFLGGLKDGMKEEDIREYFEKHGSIEQIEIMTERSTGKTRGFGFVTFEDHDTVDKLVSKRIHEIAGNKCEVKKALSKAEIEKAKSDSEMKAQRNTGYDDYGGERGGYGGYGGRGGGGYGRGGSNGYDSYSRPSYGGGAYGDSYDRDGYGYGGDSYNRYGGGGGYGGNDGYGAGGGYVSDGYGGGGGYGTGYGAGSSSYGPMKGAGQYSQRSSGPYGGGYGSGAGGSGGGYGSGGYGQGYGGGNYNAGGRY